jgi:hypothetical protein
LSPVKIHRDNFLQDFFVNLLAKVAAKGLYSYAEYHMTNWGTKNDLNTHESTQDYEHLLLSFSNKQTNSENTSADRLVVITKSLLDARKRGNYKTKEHRIENHAGPLLV